MAVTVSAEEGVEDPPAVGVWEEPREDATTGLAAAGEWEELREDGAT